MNHELIWFDEKNGKLAIGEEAVAKIQARSIANARPLGQLLTTRLFPYQRGDYERISAGTMDDEEYLAVGSIVVAALAESAPEAYMREDHITRMNILGLMPDINSIDRRWGSFSNYREKVGGIAFRDVSAFEHLSLHELINKIFEVHTLHGAPGPVTVDALDLYYRFRFLPSYRYIYNRLGGVKNINKYLGYPDIASWQPADYIAYGATVINLNGEKALTIRNMQALAKAKYGPYPQAIKRHVGWEPFQYLSLQKYKKDLQIMAARNKAVNEHFNVMNYAPPVQIDQATRATVWARFEIAAECLQPDNARRLIPLSILPTSKFLEALQTLNPQLSSGFVHDVAVRLGLKDLIWPPLANKRPPIIALLNQTNNLS